MNCNTCLKPSKKQGTYNLNQVSGCDMEFVVEEIKKMTKFLTLKIWWEKIELSKGAGAFHSAGQSKEG